MGERDSGYDSLRRRMSVLDRLTQTHPVWLLLSVSEEEADRILLKQPPGVTPPGPKRTRLSPEDGWFHGFLFFFCLGAGVPCQEVSRSAKEGALCSPGRRSSGDAHQPHPHQRESVQ